MAIYCIRHRPSGDWALCIADSAQDACERNGWVIGDCFVRRVSDATSWAGFRLPDPSGGRWRARSPLDVVGEVNNEDPQEAS